MGAASRCFGLDFFYGIGYNISTKTCSNNCTKEGTYVSGQLFHHSQQPKKLLRQGDGRKRDGHRHAQENETVIVTRKDEKNVVIISLEQYNSMMKAARNAEYLAKIDRSMQQLEHGEGKSHELIEAEDE